MIWDYQRSALFTVIWHGKIQIEPGQLIKVTGYFLKPGKQTEITAKAIVERDGTVHEQLDPPATEIQRSEIYPVEGRVYDCRPRGNDTIIGLYQTIPNLFSFPNLSHHRAFLVLPEFWNFLEEKSEYGDLAVPRHGQLSEIRRNRFDFPDIRDTTWAIHRFGLLAGIFPQGLVQEICGKIHVKLEQLDRLKKRAAFGNRMKLHLLTLSVSEGRAFLLDELVHEGPMTLEHAAFVTYSVLDLIAQLVNRTLLLDIPDKMASFTTVLGKESDEPGTKCLLQDYADLPLTKFWVEQQSLWIARFRDLRHYLAHEGTLIQIHGPNERLLASMFDNSVEEPNETFDVENEVTGWLDHATAFFERTLELLAEHSREAVKPFEGEPVRLPIEAPTILTALESAFRDLLKLVTQTTSENPDRVQHLYSRLEPSWRARWPLPKFRTFIDAWEGVGLKPSEPVSASTNGDTASMTATLLYTINGRTLPWTLRLEKPKRGKPRLVGNSLTVPHFPLDYLSVANYEARQSGRETNYACAEFRFKLTNTSGDELGAVEAIVMHGGLEAARTEIGAFSPGEVRDVFAITTPELGTLLPPGGPYMFVTLISEPVIVRIVYHRETELGNEWAEDHRCSNPPRIRATEEG